LSEDIIEVVDEMESSNTLKDFKTVLTDTAYENWKEETKDRIKHIRKFIVDGQVKFEDVEEVGYEIESFLNTAEEWEVEDDDRIYDFTTEARQLLNNLNASSVGQDKD
jgi:N-methylhydantoinase B/oxoprolinase/acetone carboxylase alpha subunit